MMSSHPPADRIAARPPRYAGRRSTDRLLEACRQTLDRSQAIRDLCRARTHPAARPAHLPDLLVEPTLPLVASDLTAVGAS